MSAWPFLVQLGQGFIQILLTPLFYIAILLVYLQYKKQVSLERKLFGVRVTSAENQTLKSLLYGILGGIVTSLLLSGTGIVFHPTDFVYVWILAVILALVFNVRFICFAYAGGILSIVSLLLNTLPWISIEWEWAASIYSDIRSLSVSHLLALVAILHLVEALLVFLQGQDGVTPVFVQSKRGRLVGGFVLQKLWVLPLAAVVATGTNGFEPPAWWTIFPVTGLSGLQIVPIPAVLGYSGVALSRHPAEKTARTSKYLAIYALLLLFFTLTGAKFAPVLLWVAAVFSPVAHEILIRFEMEDEKSKPHRFVKPLQGLRILSVIPGSPAESLQLKPGEIIAKANGVPVNSPFELHFALNQNPAFIKLEVVDEQGEIRFASKPRFDGEPHSLGLILVPDETVREYVRLDTIPIWRQFWSSIFRSSKGKVDSALHKQ
ncbi:PDZ domain-containing protein [Effusibacillus dendaii]|uniref:PDZ domain-containing protein n=1 Tax=Effusibacillus dendaii TaxID=2743772 RepID=A0A7I8DGC0_9BACL|nr:PDZ domain-containing protein [Effusibacillus dendaii]BCJ87916.1 hypothetical protein skT53_29010 [Effusibacillus dendaii]